MSRRGGAVLLLGLVLGAASCGGRAAPPQTAEPRSPLAEGDRAPTFSLRAADGSAVSIDDFRGSRAFLFYFSMGPG